MKDKLLVVADLGLLKAYRLKQTLEHSWRIELLEEVVPEEAHQRVLETVTDMAGRHAAPGQKKGAAPLADEHNLKLETKRRLIREITSHLERLIESDDWGACWLAAHKEINRQIVEQLSPTARACIGKNIPSDLTKTAEKELIEQFLNA
jgi:hypothetical protein